MKIAEILLEYKRDVTAKNLGVKLLFAVVNDQGNLNDLPDSIQGLRISFQNKPVDRIQQWMNNPEYSKFATIDIDAILAAIEAKDPTQNKQYTQWLAKMYSNGGLKLEDINRQNLLGLYIIAKRRQMIRPEHADINKFKSYKDFEDAIFPYDLTNLLRANDEKKIVNKGKSKVVYNDSEVRIIIPEDEAAACYYGQGTRWCTAGNKYNQFDAYNSKGTLYIMLPKHPEHDGEKYQLLISNDGVSDECRFETDAPYAVKDLIERFPAAMEFFIKNIRNFSKGKPEIVHKDDDVEIIEINDKAAALYYGSEVGSTFISRFLVIPRSPSHKKEKYLVSDNLNFGLTVNDIQGKHVFVTDVIKRFPSTLEFFKKLDPSIRTYISLTSDKNVDKVWTQLKKCFYKQLKISIDDAEKNNYEYLKYLKQHGYTDHQHAPSITEWNKEIRVWKDKLIKTIEGVGDADAVRKLSINSGTGAINKLAVIMDGLVYDVDPDSNEFDPDNGIISEISQNLNSMLRSVDITDTDWDENWEVTDVKYYKIY